MNKKVLLTLLVRQSGSTNVLLALLLFSCTLVQSPEAIAAPAATPTTRAKEMAVTVLHQDSNTFGKSDLFISDQAARFVGRKGDVIITTSAPNWRIILFSKSKNQALVTSPTEATKSSLGIFTSPLNVQVAQKKTVEDQTLHVKLLTFTSKGDQFSTARDAVIFQERRKRMVLDSVLETADICTVTPPVGRFINWVYNFSNLSGVPISLRTRFSDHTSETPYRTLSIEHTTKPFSFFADPTGFKAVANRLDVLLSDDATTTLEDLWGSPREGDKEKSKHR
ncbi:MAG: hypothetical protein KGS72_22305 [Cyanobacteria bacterium REEB67]|nr:hypothetical protein [Cyanobacteria bacterium REEB67]